MLAGVVFAGPDLHPVEDAVVLFDTHIQAVGPRKAVAIPDDATVVDAPDWTVMPGVVDLHVHVEQHPPRRMLAGGITTARDLGGSVPEVLETAKRSRAPGIDGPTLLAAGPMITATGGYPVHATWYGAADAACEVDGVEQARATVERLVSQGADVIKVALDDRRGPTPSLQILRALVDTAHGHHRKVTCHVAGLGELEKVLEAQADELAHMIFGHDLIPEPLLDRMVGQGVAIVTTLMWRDDHEYRVAVDNTHRFHTRGGTVLYGTDLGAGGATDRIAGPIPGVEPRELIALQDAGLSPLQVLRAATSAPARWLGLDEVGAITVGADADLLLLRGDPMSAVKKAANVQQVWRRGLAVL